MSCGQIPNLEEESPEIDDSDGLAGRNHTGRRRTDRRGHLYPWRQSRNPRYDAAETWAELFAECTGGAYSVNHAPSATMGNDVEMLTSAAAGVIQISANSQGAMSQIVPEIGLLGLPFLFKDLPTAWEVLDGEVGDMIDARAQNAGLKVIGFWDNGIRNIIHTAKNVSEPGDLSGMNIRTPPDQMAIDIFEALGAGTSRSPCRLTFSRPPQSGFCCSRSMSLS